MKTLLTLILVGLIVYGAFYIGQKYQGKKTTPTPVSLKASQAPHVGVQKYEAALAGAISEKSVEKLAFFMAPNVNFSRFESEYKNNLAQGAAAVELVKYLNESGSWQTNQEITDIEKIKESNTAFFSDSWVIVSAEKIALALIFDKDQKILNVIYISNYPAFIE